ncbi:MAG TPA: histidinol-phosphate transaminase [Candidatus Limnocylindrales bacterium]|nr:histidinol-phosphate transaminase [Candidatus Limnocylindrales bacterium]
MSVPSQRPGDPADLPVRPELRGQVPYGAPQLDVAHRLNVNENPYPPSAAMVADVAAAVAEATTGLNRYPDRDASALRADLAAYIRTDVPSGPAVTGARVWAANGSNEVMVQLLQAFGGPGRVALSFAPTYSMYPDYCRDTFTEYRTLARRDDFTVDVDAARAHIRAEQPAVILLASPNNPTGTALSLDDVDALCTASHGMVVVDEAYAEFRRPGTPSAIELLDTHPRLVVTRTMSKAFALAGARLGYLVASPQVVDAVQLVRLPYHLSAVTQAVARIALRHAPELLGSVAALRSERDDLVRWVRAQPGLVAADSDANFVLFGRFADRDAIWARLLDRGVLVRATGPEGWLRVSAGTPQEMAAFREALTESVTPGDVIA